MHKGFAADLFFPRRCVLCDEVLGTGQKGICGKCVSLLQYIEEPRCMKCGKKLSDDEEEYCYDCSKEERHYLRGFPMCSYVSPLRESLARLKYEARQEYAEFYGHELAVHFKESFLKLGIDALVPVPVSKKRRSERGYNQAELIADAMSKELHIPVDTGLLLRPVATDPLKKLTRQERVKNLMKAFSIGRQDNIPESILLVDDIYTTGATIEACSRTCLMGGVRRIYYTSVAAGKGL